MAKNIRLTISERHRESTENVRITGHTENGEAYTFHIKGENAWWFESFLSEGTQITLTRVETYIVSAGNPQEQPIRIPPENDIKVEKAT